MNRDTIEGRGPMYLVGTFLSQEIALHVARNLPRDMGGNTMYDIRTEWIAESLEELEDIKLENIVAGALKKLTDEEQQALAKYYTRSRRSTG